MIFRGALVLRGRMKSRFLSYNQCMVRKAYPTDLTDEQWKLIGKLIESSVYWFPKLEYIQDTKRVRSVGPSLSGFFCISANAGKPASGLVSGYCRVRCAPFNTTNKERVIWRMC